MLHHLSEICASVEHQHGATVVVSGSRRGVGCDRAAVAGLVAVQQLEPQWQV
jgi:hypothetical protein